MLDILLVDDDPLVRQSLAMLLEKEGFAVTSAACGQDALKAGDAQLFDLVVCDIRMPDLDGLDVVRRLQEAHLEAHFVLITGFAGEDAPIQALRLGIHDYLRKPFDLEAFLDRVRELCRQRRQRHGASPVLWRFSEQLRRLDPERDARVEEVEGRYLAVGQERGLGPRQLQELRLAAQFHDLPCRAAGEAEGDLLGRVAAWVADPTLRAAEATPVQEPAHTEKLAVQTLGKLEVFVEGRKLEPKDWESSRARWLFVYLLCQRGRRVPQERLQELLWPDADPEKSRRALVSTVHRVRKALGSQTAILWNDRCYEWNKEHQCWWDLEELEKAAPREAVALYRGEFLPECPDEWADPIRERARQRAQQAHETLVASLEDDPPACEQAARAALDHESTCEAAWAALIRALGRQGRRDEAVRAYQACERTLEQELDLRPGAEVLKAFREL